MGQDLLYLLKILPGFEYLIVLVLFPLFVKMVFWRSSDWRTVPRGQQHRRLISLCRLSQLQHSPDQRHRENPLSPIITQRKNSGSHVGASKDEGGNERQICWKCKTDDWRDL
jgi:hypothetical protein